MGDTGCLPRIEPRACSAALLLCCSAAAEASGSISGTQEGDAPVPQRVVIYDARAAASRFKLQRHSFELVRAPSYACDVYDAVQATKVLYPL